MPRPVVVALLLLAPGCRPAADRVVVYCAQDEEYAAGVFADFAAATRLAVAPKFDTEANKSVSLAVELEQDAGRPRADVHWNNEIVGTIRLARKGVYEPYSSPAAAGFPAWTRPAGRTWQAFAARARVLLVNTDMVPAADRPTTLAELTGPKWRGKVGMAKPQFGTTATQAACLFAALGPDAAAAFYRGLKANGVQVVAGNKQAATGVSAGRFAVGLTDSDDAIEEVRAGKPVTVVYPDATGVGVLFIPNTVAVVKGGPNPAGARALVDHLVSADTEAKLAAGGGFQVPLNPAVKVALPAGLKGPADVRPMAVDFDKAADLWDAAQAFLRDEFAR